MFRWPLSWCCHSSPFSFNEYNTQEWTSAICSCCHCLWTARCFRGVYFSFKPFSNNVQERKKKKKVGAFLSALAFPRCFWHEKCYSTIKKKPHFQKYLGNRTLVKSQGSESAQKIVSAGVQSLSLVVWPCKSQLCQCNGVQVFQSYSDKEKILAWQSPCLGEISYAF